MQAANKSWRWLISVLLLAAGLGARGLNADILFVDEYWSIFTSGGAPYGPLSPAEIWGRETQFNADYMGMLYRYLLSVWQATVGSTPYSVRAFSLLAGLLAIAWTYRLGRDLFSAQVGLYAAAALAASAFFADYLHEARAYTLLAMFAAFTIWAYWRLVATGSEPRAWQYGLLTLGLAGLAYTHYLGLVIEVVLGVYHLLFARKNARWRRVALAALVAALLYAPWVGETLKAVGRGINLNWPDTVTADAGQVIETLLHTASNGSVALLALAAAYALLERRRQAGFVWFLALATLALMLTANARVPFIIHPRYLIGLWPLLAVILGMGMARLARAGLNPALVLAVWMGVGVWQSFRPAFIHDLFGQSYRAPRAGIEQALDILRERGGPDDMALFHISKPGEEPFNYFVLGYLMRDLPLRYDQIERMNNSFALDDNHYLMDVNQAMGGAPFVWTLVVPEAPTTQRSIVVNYVLNTQYARCETVLDRPDMHMTLYARAPQDISSAPYVFTAARGEIGLFPLRIAPRAHTLDVLLGWAMDTTIPPDTYSAAVHVENQRGELVATGDHGLPPGPLACSAAHIVLEDLPPGEYTLLAGVYDWRSGERLTATARETGETADRFVIGAVMN